MSAVTLQINLSPGDVAYAAQTVPALLRSHPAAAERLLIVDTCKPQRTGIVDPARRFPEPAYSERARAIEELAHALRRQGAVDRVVVLRPDDPLFTALRRRYLRPWVRGTHDYGGCALLAYLAAFELCSTRWLLHYDADVLLHQAPGVDWSALALSAMAEDPTIVATTPRPSPPPPAGTPDAPTRTERFELRETSAGWLNPWFSTRCFLFDLERLRPHLPLMQGRVYWESLAARLLRRGFPRSPEALLFRRMSAAGLWRLTLRAREAWMIHPTRKDSAYLVELPRILQAVHRGAYPAEQAGETEVLTTTWQRWLANHAPP
jgi:hypothetical protein